MRNVILVSQQQLEGVLPVLERDLCLALPAAEMKMIEVVGNRLIERRQLGVNQEMMMAGILPSQCRQERAPCFSARNTW